MGEFTLAREEVGTLDVLRLIERLDAYQASLYPAASNHLVDLAGMRGSILVVARHEGVAVGCAALCPMDGYGEIKRMYVEPSMRGRGLGRDLLAWLEREAVSLGMTCLRLETGVSQAAALTLYRVMGYVARGPYGDYPPDPLSVFMEKQLGVVGLA